MTLLWTISVKKMNDLQLSGWQHSQFTTSYGAHCWPAVSIIMRLNLLFCVITTLQGKY